MPTLLRERPSGSSLNCLLAKKQVCFERKERCSLLRVSTFAMRPSPSIRSLCYVWPFAGSNFLALHEGGFFHPQKRVLMRNQNAYEAIGLHCLFWIYSSPFVSFRACAGTRCSSRSEFKRLERTGPHRISDLQARRRRLSQ